MKKDELKFIASFTKDWMQFVIFDFDKLEIRASDSKRAVKMHINGEDELTNCSGVHVVPLRLVNAIISMANKDEVNAISFKDSNIVVDGVEIRCDSKLSPFVLPPLDFTSYKEVSVNISTIDIDLSLNRGYFEASFFDPLKEFTGGEIGVYLKEQSIGELGTTEPSTVFMRLENRFELLYVGKVYIRQPSLFDI